MPGISDFKSRLVGGGARANLFQVTLDWPFAVDFQRDEASFLIKAASLPGSQVGNIDLPYRGRMLKVAGDRTFENWTVTVINDNNMQIRNAMETWMSLIASHGSNTETISYRESYYKDLAVDQLDRKEQIVKSYIFKDAYPINISAIELDYGTNDAIEDFTVEFAYQYWDAASVVV
jgi:hypothetical protein